MHITLGLILACSSSPVPSEPGDLRGDDTPTLSESSPAAPIAAQATLNNNDTPALKPSEGTGWNPIGFESHPLYFHRSLTAADLEGKTLRELSLMRNLIFARIGNSFVKPWLDQYFRQFTWYKPTKYLQFENLSPYDRSNAAFIATHESQFSNSELTTMRKALYDKKAARRMQPEDERELHLIAARLGEWSGDDSMPIQSRNPLEDPNSLKRQLTLSQVDKMSRRDLRLLRNTIFARYGRPFRSDILRNHFGTMSWYKVNPDYSASMLSAVDKRNIQLIQSMENKLGGALSDDDHAHEIGWYGGA